jgi:hypothetical protein
MLRFNEGKACEAVIRQVEARAKAPRSNVILHDTHPLPDRRVELTFEVADTLYALEHTGIEPFEDFMRMSGDAKRLYDPIVHAVSGVLPPHETVKMTMGALFGKNRKDLRAIHAALARYVIATASSIPLRGYADYIGNVKPVTPPGVPFAVKLYRFFSPNTPARFMIQHVLTADREKLRAKRIQQAVDDKFPKLAAWKADGARTILILEDNDIQLTNESLVANAFVKIAKERNDRPDETYMLNTCTAPTWYAWPILIDGVSFFDLSERYHPIHIEIDSATLTGVTHR